MLTTDADIRRLNKEWRGKNKATDVLSFPLQDHASLKKIARQKPLTPWELGDVVISLPTAQAQARARNHSLRQELDLLLVHGILHLLGFDHEISAAGERRMRYWEQKLVGKRGLL